MRPADFFTEPRTTLDDPALDLFGGPSRLLNEELIRRLRRGPLAEHSDVEAAVALARLIHDDLEASGTGGGEELSDEQMREAIQALRTVLSRLGLDEFDLPFRGHGTWRGWWIRQGASGSGGWQARRNLLSGLFDSLHDQLADMEQASLTSSLAEAISPHARTGWPAVDAEISELRRHFLRAATPQDYRNVGQDCVAVTEALSRTVYDPARHLREGEQEPPVANTKARLERFVEDAAPGPDNAAIRRLARMTIELAQHVKHSETPTRREAGIAADAVILLANILRRLDERD